MGASSSGLPLQYGKSVNSKKEAGTSLYSPSISECIVILNQQNGKINCYNSGDNSWSYLSETKPTEYMRICCTKGKLFLLSENKLFKFSKDKGFFAVASLQHTPKEHCAQIVVFEENIYLVENEIMSCFDPGRATWAEDLPGCRLGIGQGFCVTASDKNIYALGFEACEFLHPCHVIKKYNPESKSWCELNLPTPCHTGQLYGSAYIHNNILYFVGGSFGSAVQFVDRFSVKKQTWITKRETDSILKLPRHHFTTCVANGKLYAVGGAFFRGITRPENQESEDSIEVFDDKYNEWNVVTKMEGAEGYVSACVMQSDIS